jgi:tRNA A37 threonylcarbamoyladenosine dehydratase
MSNDWNLKKDLKYIVELCERELKELSTANIFITGGTGFIGCWILESIRHSNLTLKTNISATILTRSNTNFEKTKMIKKKNIKKIKSGILFLKNIPPSVCVIRVINFLKKH